jgi:hypothetical protein
VCRDEAYVKRLLQSWEGSFVSHDPDVHLDVGAVSICRVLSLWGNVSTTGLQQPKPQRGSEANPPSLLSAWTWPSLSPLQSISITTWKNLVNIF